MTSAEQLLWRLLRAQRLSGISFRRQMPISGYIVDFAAPAHRLIVELDGGGHAKSARQKLDKKRDFQLQSLGWTVLRIWNSELQADPDGVCRRILAACGKEHF